MKVITLATIAIHNWLRSESPLGKIAVETGLVDIEDCDTGRVLGFLEIG